jgi:hypothetical protein
MQNLLLFETGSHSRDRGQPVTVSGNVSIPFSRAGAGMPRAGKRASASLIGMSRAARGPFSCHIAMSRNAPGVLIAGLPRCFRRPGRHRMFTD